MHAVAAAPDFDDRLQVLNLRRPVQHGDRIALCQPQGGDIEAAKVRSEVDDALAASFRFLDQRQRLNGHDQLARFRHRTKPYGHQFHSGLAGFGDVLVEQALEFGFIARDAALK